ncbi:MAG: flippase [Patescibacteria group bacterium]
MIKIIKELINKNKLLIHNFSALSALQVAEYVFPLITLPYLVRVLGPDKFGLVVFAQSFIAYFILLTEYGFKLSATREISINRNDNNKVSQIFCSVYIVYFLLFIVSTAVFSVIVFNIPKFHSEYIVYLFAYIMVFGTIIFPVWLFQGMEKMKYITIINVSVKLLFLIFIFIFIKNQDDYIYVPLISSLGFLMSGLIALVFGIKIFKIKLILPKYHFVLHQLKEGWYIFISTIAISLYSNSNVFILGMFTSNTVVGYYSGAEKIIKAVKSLMIPISQSVYPHINKIANESHEKALFFIKKLFKIVGGGTFVMSSIIFLFADRIISVALGPQYQQSIIILRLLSFLPFLVGLSNVLGIQTMLTFNFKKAFSKILSIAGLFSIVAVFIIAPIYQGAGIALTLLITELFITISMFVYLYKKGLNILTLRKNEKK